MIEPIKLIGNYRAKVVDVSDPLLAGRIKIQVYPVMKDIEAEDLPWAVPAMPLFSGAGAGYGSFCVPAMDSFVFCFFENGDMYQPVYFAEAQTGLHGIPASAKTNYPNRKVLKTKNGIEIIVDDTKGHETISILHPKGSSIVFDEDGKVKINCQPS